MQNKITKCLSGLFFGLLFLSLTLTADAQFRAAVQGSIVDSTGAVVTGANVTLTNNETGRVQQTTSNDNGFYR